VQNANKAQNYNRYSNCLNNPLKYTDPSGWLIDGYTVDKDGNIERVERIADNFDVIYTKENWNSGKKDKSIIIDKHILKNININQSYITKNLKTGKSERINYNQYLVKGDNEAFEMFNFLQENTNVECGLTIFGYEGTGAPNFIITSNEKGREVGSSGVVVR
jgi:hypothetical protein